MEYKSVSAKITRDESTLLKAFCERKGTTPSALIRELILRELKFPIPHAVAGRNKIYYDRNGDRFVWSIQLDNGEEAEILRNISPSFLEDLEDMMSRVLEERYSFIGKTQEDSVTVPSSILRRERE